MNKKDLKMEHTTGKEQMTSINHLITHDEIVGYDNQGKSLRSQYKLVTNDKIVDYDAYGWPTYHLRVISFLRVLGVSDVIIKQIPENILKTHISTSTNECTNCNIDLEKGEIYVF